MSKQINLGLNLLNFFFLLLCERLGESCVLAFLCRFPSLFRRGLENWLQPVDFPLNNQCDTQKRQALALTRLQLDRQDAGDTLKTPVVNSGRLVVMLVC